MSEEKIIAALRSMIALATQQLETIDGEWGSGHEFAELLLEGDGSAKVIQAAIDVLAGHEGKPS